MTIEELKSYIHVHTPNTAALAECVNRAKGYNRTMAEFASATGITPSKLSRIVNRIITKPLSIDVIAAIYENRASTEDERLLDDLAKANGLVSPDYAEKADKRNCVLLRPNDHHKRMALMHNAILAGVAASGITILANDEDENIVERETSQSYFGCFCNLLIKISKNTTTAQTWRFCFNATLLDEVPIHPRKHSLAVFMQRISPLLLRDAWMPQTLTGSKTSFVFIDKSLFDAFIEAMQPARVNNEFSVLLLDPNSAYGVVKEVWIPGQCAQLSENSIFESSTIFAYEDDYFDQYDNEEDF